MSNRRTFLKSGVAASLGFAGVTSIATSRNFPVAPRPKPDKAFRILHFTDLHIRPEYEAPRRYQRIMNGLMKKIGKIDLVLNGGDTIYAADYRHIKRERVIEQWKLWDDVVLPPLKGIEMLSALGNHDMWWVPGKKDPMYGKDYVLKRLKQKSRYMSIKRGGWLIITLDCNNSGLLDKEQLTWLHDELKRHPKLPALILSHQPIILAESVFHKGISKRQKEITAPLISNNRHARPIHFVSGHIHILDTIQFNNISFHCNGAISGAWWEPHIDAKDCSVKGTPMGYAVIDIFPDGQFKNQYHDVTDCKNGKIIV